MNYIVNMVRDSTEAGGRDHFACSAEAWGLLLDLGKAFDWRQQGTTYLPTNIANMTVNAARHGYRPGDAKDYKRISAEDALAWARALTEARRSPQLEQIVSALPASLALNALVSSDELPSTKAPFAIIMNEFIEYAFGGEFVFALAE